MVIPEKYRVWIEAKKKHHLSHAQVQMARELGMNPKKLGKIDNHKQEPWKAPLPDFIQSLYFKRFGRDLPIKVVSIEEQVREEAKKKAQKKAKKIAEKRQFVQINEIVAKEDGNV